MSWWDNLVQLQAYYGRVQWGLAISGLITATLVVISLRWNDRIGALQDKEKDSTALRISNNERETASANKAAAAASERANLLEQGTAQLQKDAAEARLELEQIRERQRLREVTNIQKAIFIRETGNLPKGKVTVFVKQQDAEIGRYANQIRGMIAEAGFDSGIMVGIGLGSSADPIGVIICIKDPMNLPPFCDGVRGAFVAAGINVSGVIDPSLNADEVMIVVGRKAAQ